MRSNPIPLITICILTSFSSLAQLVPLQGEVNHQYDLLLKSGTVIPDKNITTEALSSFNNKAARTNNKTFAVIQFEQIPTEGVKQQLKQAGVELLDYIPNNAYTVTITGSLNASFLTAVKARSVIELSAYQKMQPALAKGNFPAHAVKVAGTVDAWISFPKSFSFETVSNELRSRNFDITSSLYKEYNIIALRVAVQRLGELALLPFIEYVESAPGEDQPLNVRFTNFGRDLIKGTLLGAPLSVGGKNLKGSGVVIGIGDDGDPQEHIDFTNRLISRAAGTYSFHATHVTGIVAGGAIRNEIRLGLAPKSTVVSQIFSNIFANAPAYVADYNMVITNNSYGDNVSECSSFGVYDLYSRILDQQAFNLPHLQNVFAAGNSGHFSCAPYPDSFKTVLGGYQSAKNVITVGNATPVGYLFTQSSKGPVKDGRIKPEIIAIGSFIESTVPPPFNYYWETTGTSMASPAIAGGLALLYEKYRQRHPIPAPWVEPPNGLMKALVCNSGDDWGKPGPDYKHGFGLANFWRAVTMLEDDHYFEAGIAALDPPKSEIISVPAGLAELKVMLYWNDPAAAVLASQTLVNDLDLEVVTPSSATVLPLVLDTIPANVKNDATNGVDHINNIEQVVIKNPASGNYNIIVKATNITQNSPQQYFIVYDFVPLETKVISPMGGESYVHGESMVIAWDSYGDPQNTFTVEFRPDNSSSWTTLKNNIQANKREYFYIAPNPNEWFIIPEVTTDQAEVRVTRNSTGFTSTSLPFTICDTMNVTLSSIQCEGYVSIDWAAVTGATGYEVMRLIGDEMVTVATVSAATLNYTFSGLSKDSVYWVTARPLIGSTNSPGRRGLAISRKPDTGTCSGNISDNDLKVDAFTSPASSGREFTSTSLSATTPISIRIKNLDDQSSSGNINVSYSINGVLQQTETIAPAIAAGGTVNHIFSLQANLSAVGTYSVSATVTKATDLITANNSLMKIFKQLDNQPVSLPFTDNIDAAPAQSVTASQMGLQGLDRYDFVNNTIYGRVRTFINTGIAASGNRALSLDADRYNAGNTDSLTGTYNINLAGYNPLTDEIRLDFRYKNHGQDANAVNKVWVRGSDADVWKEAYDLFANQNPVDGTFKKSSSIELTDILAAAPVQTFSPSFQIRWGQYGQQQAADNDGGAGYTFDDIHLYKVTDDMQMISIDAPVSASCALTATTPVTITVRNSSNTSVTNVPVRFRVDGGSYVSDELIPAIAANSTAQFTFLTSTANLAAFGSHLIEVRVAYTSDTYPDNDTISLSLVNSPIINVTSSTPHLQTFETDNGSWYAGGNNNSWQYGTPASAKINRAASGSKAWKTRVTGNYNDKEKSYLYSPCYNISTLTAPTLSFSLALDLEDCGSSFACDGAYVEYSSDGTTWVRLGASGQGTNWYNRSYAGNNMWSVQNYHRWHMATIPLPIGLNQLRLRFVVASDQSVNRDGIAIDDIHVYDNLNGIYTTTGTSPVVNQPIVNGTGWVHFIETGTNKLVASINPNGQDLGNTDVQSYINTGAVRIDGVQFYHNRNITVKPTNVNLSDSATVRFYFLDTEMEALINATGCSYCFKPSMVNELGVTKYSNTDDSKENGTLADNIPGNYLFINSANTRIVPFDKGYYAEFRVKNFSEFWLNNGGLGNNQPLPVQLIDFTARKKDDKDVLAAWATASESNVNRFEIEVAKGNAAYQQNQFVKLGEVRSLGNSIQEQQYIFTDNEFGKIGVRYYRLKIIDNDGSFKYSAIRPVVFDEEIKWQVYPNPSVGVFNLSLQANDGELVNVKIYDLVGKIVQQHQLQADGFVQKINIDLRESQFAAGLYLLEATAGDKKQAFRIIKQ